MKRSLALAGALVLAVSSLAAPYLINPYSFVGSAGTAPTVQSATLNSAGTQLTVVFDQDVIGASDKTITLSVGGRTGSYASGEGESAVVWNITPHAATGTITWSYTQAGGGIRGEVGGVDLATVSGGAITNNSKWLLSEGYEGTGLPAGHTDITGTPDYDNTSGPVVGAQSALLPTGVGIIRYQILYTQGDYVVCRVKTSASDITSDTAMIIAADDSTGTLGSIQYRASNNKFAVLSAGGTVSTESTFTASAGGVCWIMFRFTNPAGSNNATTEAWFSDDGVTWDDVVSSTDGTSTATATRIYFRNFNTGIDVRIDSVKRLGSSVDIGEIE